MKSIQQLCCLAAAISVGSLSACAAAVSDSVGPVIRHDVDVQRYLIPASGFPALADRPTKSHSAVGSLNPVRHSAPSSAAAGQIGDLLRTAHARGVFNGEAIVVHEGAIVFNEAFGFADGGRTRLLDRQDRYSIGSISKEFSAVAIMILEQRGQLRLDDPVSRHLTDLPPWATTVRVRDLLDYTSGLPLDRGAEVPSEEDLVNDLRALEALNFEPGTDYLYSNNNILLRRLIVEAVTGKSFPAFSVADIFVPCGMDGAVIDPARNSPHLARAFNNDLVEDDISYAMVGWASVTATDLYRWTECLHGGALLPSASVARLVQSANDRQGALGHLVVAEGRVRRHVHDGSHVNFQSNLYVDTERGTTVLLLTNNKNSMLVEITDAILAILGGPPH